MALLYNGLVEFLPAPPIWETFLSYLLVLDNLGEVCGYSVVTDFISVMRFSVVLGC